MSYNHLDNDYHPVALDAIRKMLHKEIVMKQTFLDAKDYKIYFHPNAENDLSFIAGTPFVVIIKVHPYDPDATMSAVKYAFSKTAIIKQMRIAKQVVRQKDAAIWYGVDMDNVRAYQKQKSAEFERARFSHDIIDTIIIVRVTDNYTGKSMTITARRADAITLGQKAEQQLKES